MSGYGQHPRRRMHRWEWVSSARFLTFSCFGRLALFNNPAICDHFVETLAATREKHRFRLIAWVIMPEHVHLLIVPQPLVFVEGGEQFVASRSTVRQILFTLKTSTSQSVIARWMELKAPILPRIREPDGSHHFWLPGGGFDRNTRDDGEFDRTLAYIHQNPVTRELVKAPVDWPWSSARWYAGQDDPRAPIDAHRVAADYWEPPEEWCDEAVRLRDIDGS